MGIVTISKRDYESNREGMLEVATCTAAFQLSKTPSPVRTQVRKIAEGFGSDSLPITWRAMNEAGFPALFSPMVSEKAESGLKLSTLFSAPLTYPFSIAFQERYPELREQVCNPHSDVVGVVFRWPGIKANMILRDGKAPPDSAIAIRIDGSLRFVETLDNFVRRVTPPGQPWWE